MWQAFFLHIFRMLKNFSWINILEMSYAHDTKVMVHMSYLPLLDTVHNYCTNNQWNTQIGKDKNNKLVLHNLPNRNGKYQTDFWLMHSLLCLNTKFKKGRESYGPTPTQILLKHS